MISLNIKDLKNFMSHLFIKNTFDDFLLCEAEIKASCSFSIDGKINKDFYSKEELENLGADNYVKWANLKNICFQMIKGSHTPSSIKLIFRISDNIISSLIDGLSLSLDDINGLYINLKYMDGKTTIVTGTSIKIFTMDKSLDKVFDNYTRQFLENSNIPYDEL